MEGILLKWTNYYNGWQPRWFVLDDGILSYYKSEQEVSNGCKGSINMSVCNVSVHQTDPCRLDLVIPSEAHFYVKANSPSDRQQWLVSLGTCKATHDDNTIVSIVKRRSSSLSKDSDLLRQKKSELRLYSDLLMQQVYSLKTIGTSCQNCEHLDTTNEKLDDATKLLSVTCDTFIRTLDECIIAVSDIHSTHNEVINGSETNIVPPSSSLHSPRIKVG